MTITDEQRDILVYIMNHKNSLEELWKELSKEKKVSDLKIGESIKLADISWSKFAEDSKGNAYILADETICDMSFGDSNDWRESQIRKKLNDEINQKIADELGTDALIAMQIDLFSHDGFRDYGKCEDKVSLLTYDLYRNNRKNIKRLDESWWLNTPDSTPSGYEASFVLFVDSDGNVGYGVCSWGGFGVRPFCILKSDIFVSCEE